MKVLFFQCVCLKIHVYINSERGKQGDGNVVTSLQTSESRPANSISFERMYFAPLSLKIVIKSESSCNF